MHTEDYVRGKTGILLVDPYNDFLSPTGKLWPQAKEVAEEVNLLSNLKSIVGAARQSGVRIFVVPHHRWEPGDYIHWKHANPRQLAGAKNQIFAKGTWGGEWHPDFVPQEGDIIIKEHWAQSGFANTDLDQQLKQHGIEKIILIGMLANTCIESTGRFGMELGYHVNLASRNNTVRSSFGDGGSMVSSFLRVPLNCRFPTFFQIRSAQPCGKNRELEYSDTRHEGGAALA